MRCSFLRWTTTGLAGLAIACGGGTVGRADDDVAEEVVREIREDVLALVGDEDVTEEVTEGEYWLGVACSEVPDKTRQELILDEGQGLVVLDVVPDSPAAKAGLQKDDVLLMAGDVTLADVNGLIKKVQATKDSGELKIIVIRAGEKKEITAKPEKRDVKRRVIEWKREPFNLQILRPGRVLPPQMALKLRRPELPDDMTITITRHGKEPTKITVQQGDKNWEVTDDKVDDLPEDVRKHVEPMLGRFTMALPAPVGDVLTYVPNAEEFHLRYREATNAVRDAERKAMAEAKRAAEAAASAEGEAKMKAMEAVAQAKRKVIEVRRAAEKQVREAEHAAEDAARGAVKRTFEETHRVREEHLEKRFEELNRRMDELRKAIESYRQDRSPPEKSDAPKPEKSDA